ncbi:MAG TPA: ABC transporter permease subunit [Candidatus Polarisedimenticolaceae bacterium]|nr:ABC transporter permease subunit [Candidatus Polarisedimenticolaceae bacterium]
MRALLAVCTRELRSQLASPLAWTIAAGFLVTAGYFFFSQVVNYAEAMQQYEMYAQLSQDPTMLERFNLNLLVEGMFSNVLVLLLFVVPILSMGSIAEERRRGTDELLLTAPLGPGGVVAGKFLGLLLVLWAMLAGSGLFLFLLTLHGNPERGPIWTGMVGLALVSAGLLALGLAVSAATSSQAVAGIGTFVLSLLLFALAWPAEALGGAAGKVLGELALPPHFDDFTKGLITGSDVAYFVSLAALGLFVARALLASQRWR